MGKEISIMPCLDMQNGRVVKGVHFVDIKDAGDPVQCAQAYCEAGADELALLDITATSIIGELKCKTISSLAPSSKSILPSLPCRNHILYTSPFFFYNDRTSTYIGQQNQ